MHLIRFISRFAALVLTCSAVLFGGGGCAQWKSSTSSSGEGVVALLRGESAKPSTVPNVTQVSRSKSTGLVVEIEFVTVDSDKANDLSLDSLWQWIDETTVDAGERRTLVQNGLRVGRVLDESRFRDQLKLMEHDESILDEFMQTASIGSNLKRPKTEHSMRLGRRFELPVGKPLSGEVTTIVKWNGQIVGRTLMNPQFVFTIEPSGLKGAQEIDLKFRPEVQHGQMRNQLIGADSALRINRHREVWPLDGLQWQIPMRAGDVVVVGADHRGKGLRKNLRAIGSGLADRMLHSEHADLGSEQLFVLVKLKELPSP